MLVDHHCHLDFPEFASELDQVVARAREAGVATQVTISTRIREFDKLKAIVERFDDVFCSVGTHPHNAHEELDIPLERIIELS
ncbi:MAG: TatD family hydrolase, partial [Hyphomicrobium sp.]